MPLSPARILTVTAAVLLCGCAGRMEQYYPDRWYTQDRIYQNETLGFALMYRAGWRIQTAFREMSREQRTVARTLRGQGAELLYVGATAEGAYGTRAIVEHLNKTPEDFAAALRAANAPSLDKDMGVGIFMAGQVLCMKWEYVFRGLRFVEFLFSAASYNVRIAFWTTPERYEEFLPEFEAIMTTLNLRAAP